MKLNHRIAGTVFVFTFAWLVAELLGIQWGFFEPLAATVSAGLAWFALLPSKNYSKTKKEETDNHSSSESEYGNRLHQLEVDRLSPADRAIAEQSLAKWKDLRSDFLNNRFTRAHPKDRYTKIRAFSYWLDREYWQISEYDFQTRVSNLKELLEDFVNFCDKEIIYKPVGPPYHDLSENKIKPGVFGGEIRNANEKSQEVFSAGSELESWLSDRL